VVEARLAPAGDAAIDLRSGYCAESAGGLELTPRKKAKAGYGHQTSSLGLARVGNNKHLPAVGQTEMRHLDGLVDTINLDVFLAPIELAGVAGGQMQAAQKPR
jgi:hypothetical protein